MLETGEIGRFATVGDFASYCRCVGSQQLRNGKRKGQGNTKNGNKYLAWAFVEAANFAVRYNFESGLFMGVLGRERVFLVYDQAVGLKIPSDLAGVTLASYDGSRIESQDAAAAVRRACRLISEKITASRFPHLIGERKSRYLMTYEGDMPLVDDDVEIRACRNGISIISKRNSQDDNYTAFGWLPLERKIMGEWKSRQESYDTGGLFVLTINPTANYMYGYFTSPNETRGVTYTPWVLAKANADEAKVNRRLKQAQDILMSTTINLLSRSSGS